MNLFSITPFLGKYGVIDETGVQIVPFEYDSILFIGGSNAVLLKKDGLWGAKGLIGQISLNLNIPCAYKELVVVDEVLTRFSALMPATKFKEDHFVLINNRNEILLEEATKIVRDYKKYDCLDSHFQRIDEDHYITSIDHKYGMISEHGFVSIPFIYDEIYKRKDGNFDVLKNGWGIIGLDGRTIVSCKYTDPIPDKSDNGFGFIVRERDSLFSGFLLENGQELIPAVHQHLMFDEENECFYNGFGGEYYEYWRSEFSDIRDAKWGCITKNGKQIIPQKYDVIYHKEGFILAGRDGRWSSENYPQSE